MTDPAPILTVTLPGVVSWARPRRTKGRVRYPGAYARARDAWELVVAHAVHTAGWQPPATARFRVTVDVSGGGRRDLDRICTAVLDALQRGGAVRDDCLVDELTARRSHRSSRPQPATVARVAIAPWGAASRPDPARARRAALCGPKRPTVHDHAT